MNGTWAIHACQPMTTKPYMFHLISQGYIRHKNLRNIGSLPEPRMLAGFLKIELLPSIGITFTKSSVLYIFPMIHDRYLLGITGNIFWKSQQLLHLCKGIRSGLHGNRARAKETDTSIHLGKRDKDAQCTLLVEWGGGVRGSKDNYKGRINKVRK